MSDFSFIDDRPSVVFTLAGVASQPGADRLLRPLTQQQFARLLEGGFASFFDDFARRLVAGQRALLGELRPYEADRIIGLFQPVVTLPGIGQGYLQSAALGLVDGIRATRGEPQTIATFFVGGEQLDIQALEVALQSGSLFANIMAGLGGAGALAAAVFFFGQPDYNNFREDLAWNQRIERVMDGQACVLDIGATINVNELRRLVVNDLRVGDRTLSEPERRQRVCYTQLLLRTAGAYPGEIDGVDGPTTQRAKEAFAKRVGLEPRHLDTPIFFEALIDSIQRKI